MRGTNGSAGSHGGMSLRAPALRPVDTGRVEFRPRQGTTHHPTRRHRMPTTTTGKRAGKTLSWPAELIRARDRNDARRAPTHRKDPS